MIVIASAKVRTKGNKVSLKQLRGQVKKLKEQLKGKQSMKVIVIQPECLKDGDLERYDND